MDKQEIDKGNAIIATWLGYKYYPVCKVVTTWYECEYYGWEEMDEGDVWVLNPTEEFEKTPCTSAMYWEYERDMPKQWEDYDQYLAYHSSCDELMPIAKKVVDRLQPQNRGMISPYIAQMARESIEQAALTWDIEPLWRAIVSGIQVINGIKEESHG